MANRERAAKLLGQGIQQEIVATALGVTPGYISQLLSEPEFAAEVSQLRLVNLENASERDGKYDKLEDKMLDQLEELAGYMTKPREVLSALAVLNKAVRRGVKQEQQPAVKQDVVTLVLPQIIQQTFILNQSNQVVAVGEKQAAPVLQDLTTISAKALLERTSKRQAQTVEVNPNGHGRQRIGESIASG